MHGRADQGAGADVHALASVPGRGTLVAGRPSMAQIANLTLAALAAAKCLPLAFLQGLGLHDLPGGGVAIPYLDETGEKIAVKRRLALSAREGSRWPGGQRIA